MPTAILETPLSELTRTGAGHLAQFLHWLELFRQINPEIASQHVALFIHVALKQGQSLQELGRKVGVSQSSMTRHLATMSRWGPGVNKPGYDLLTYEQEGKERRVYLTAKGQRLLDTFLRL